MFRFGFRPFALFAAAGLVLASCSTEEGLEPSADAAVAAPSVYKLRNGVENTIEVKEGPAIIAQNARIEGFESGSKGSYAAGNVTLGTGSWWLSNALIGNISGSDRFSGTRSARLSTEGEVSSNFAFNGVGTVTVQAARYGSDATSSLELWISTDGNNYSKVGSTVTVSSTTLTTYTFTVNRSGNVYLDFFKSTGGSARINIDNITVNAFGSTGGGSTGGGSTGGGSTGGGSTGGGSTGGGSTGGGSTGGSTGTGRDNHLTFGNPSGAVASSSVPNNFLSVKNEFVISYNSSKGTPNWVSWHLNQNWLGSTSRTDAFAADLSLPSSFFRPDQSSYSGSGFDRGHMCPSADRNFSSTENRVTFLMSNMVPQSPDNNQGVWNNMEGYLRSLVSAGNELFVISGPSRATGGTGSSGARTTTGGGVTVPNYVWKVVVVLPNGSNDINRVTSSTRIIAVIVPNTQGIRNNAWTGYRTTVDRIESENGLNLLDLLPDSIENALEARVDNVAA